MPSKVWIDGKLFDKDDAKVSVFDHGLLFGDGVSAGMRVYGGRVFALNDHLSLLYESATVFTLTIPLSLNDLARVVEETARSNGRAEGYVRLMVTRGAGTLGLDPRKCDPTVIIIAEDLIPYPRELYDSGLEVHTFGPGDPVRHPCTLSRIDAVFVKAAAIQNGCLEPILLDKACSVIGTADGEVFAVFGNSLKHSTAPGGVDRVAWALIRQLAAQAGIPVIEVNLSRDELLTADEVFLASTAAEIIAVAKVDNHPIGDGREGPITRRLRDLYRETVRGPNPGLVVPLRDQDLY
jgi:branched-chain amino acid aminotransferase